MRYAIAGEPCTVGIDFTVDGAFVVPDPGSVTYSLRGPGGQVLPGHADLPLAVEGDRAIIAVPAAANQKTAERESRFVHVKYTHRGASRMAVSSYVLIDFLPIATTPEDVRAEMGLSEAELPDDAIDLPRAYFAVRDDYPDLATALGEGVFAANLAILYRACVMAATVLETRLRQQEQADGLSVARLRDLDLAGLRARLGALYAEALADLAATAGEDPVLLLVTQEPDPVTGG